MPLGLALLSAAFPPERRGTAIGIFSAITGIAVASGPLIGGAVVQGISWQWIFWLNVPIGADRRAARADAHGGELRPGRRPRPRGLALVDGRRARASCGASSAATRRAGAAPRSSRRSLPGRCCSAAFVAWERRARGRCCRSRFFRSRGFSAGNTAIFFTFAALFSSVFFYAQLLQSGSATARSTPGCG